MRRRLRSLGALLAAGAGITLLIAWSSLLLVDLSAAPAARTAHAYDGRVQWDVSIARSAFAVRINSLRQSGLDWGVEQACGPPDSKQMADERTAWASDSADGSAEWLELSYARPVRPAALLIYENFNPGAIVRVTIFDDVTGEEQVVWRGAPTGAPPATARSTTNATIEFLTATQPPLPVHVLTLPISTSIRTRRVRLDLDSQAVAGWNEIDAVALVDSSGARSWAASARASTTYPGGRSGNDDLTPVLPYWSGLYPVRPDSLTSDARKEERMIEGCGMPMAALRFDLTGPTRPPRFRGVIWRGFALDSVIFAIVTAVAWWLATYPAKFIRESSRLRRGCCIKCGYDLRFDFISGCPECGWRRE